MLTSDAVISKLKSDKQILKSLHLSGIGLFGSTARGDNTEKSDLDFLVDYEEGFKSWTNFNKTCDYIERYFGNNYDIVTKEGISERMFNNISKDIIYVRLND